MRQFPGRAQSGLGTLLQKFHWFFFDLGQGIPPDESFPPYLRRIGLDKRHFQFKTAVPTRKLRNFFHSLAVMSGAK